MKGNLRRGPRDPVARNEEIFVRDRIGQAFVIRLDAVVHFLDEVLGIRRHGDEGVAGRGRREKIAAHLRSEEVEKIIEQQSAGVVPVVFEKNRRPAARFGFHKAHVQFRRERLH